jgi:DNA adenine methylase
MQLPATVPHVRAPPIKCQGIKTKLVRTIAESVNWSGKGRWIEPFLGSGVVLFNLVPERAIASDINEHLIRFYQGVQSNRITASIVRSFLEEEGTNLRTRGDDYYYQVRDRFNARHDPLDLLFLNRACFNGVMRFNKKGRYNVPFGHKLDRFRPAYITKIVNQVSWVADVINGRDWTFRACGWAETLSMSEPDDFVYCDPPYFGRNTDYYGDWAESDMERLVTTCRGLRCGFAFSMWNQNEFRKNTVLWKFLGDLPMKKIDHFYHVGSTEELRHPIEEALVFHPNFISTGLDSENCQAIGVGTPSFAVLKSKAAPTAPARGNIRRLESFGT